MSRAAERTGPGRQRSGADAPTSAGDPVSAAWVDYLAAARQLDGIRREAAIAAGEQARTVQAAREELAAVRTRLAPQEGRLRELDVPPVSLAPSPPELQEAARLTAGGPAAVLAALREARVRAEAAEAALSAGGLLRPGGWPAPLRNLLVYGPLAVLVPLLQVLVLAVTGPGAVTVAALVCGLPMPAVAFAAGWLGVWRLFGSDPAVPVDRTARLGALVCLLPALAATTVLLLALLAA
ncbi:hypothetical protein GA0070616_2180 [Micromonospora nigra]|uniref:Uncharacterized protein n=1 Tax=Micromonospora nigra TaxID=145857 RepID=A0A1C6RV81_9ACTN|nr:hypothetical protein [Micromonospora nigra]SCL21034.1 hypothetical protein GA0070616_2180 [Micromonospora nigra]